MKKRRKTLFHQNWSIDPINEYVPSLLELTASTRFIVPITPVGFSIFTALGLFRFTTFSLERLIASEKGALISVAVM